MTLVEVLVMMRFAKHHKCYKKYYVRNVGAGNAFVYAMHVHIDVLWVVPSIRDKFMLMQKHVIC